MRDSDCEVHHHLMPDGRCTCITSKCDCVIKNRQDGETQREWLKRWMCQWHWMETDYYQAKLEYNRFLVEKSEREEER